MNLKPYLYSEDIMSQLMTNLSYFDGHSQDTKPGMWLQHIVSLEDAGQLDAAVILGGVKRQRPTEGSRVIPIAYDDLPRYEGNKVFEGSIIKRSVTHRKGHTFQQKVLVAYKDPEQVWYCLVRTGLRVRNGGTTDHLMEFRTSKRKFQPHNSFSLDESTLGSLKIENASHGLLDIGTTAATREKFQVTRDQLPSVHCPEFRHDLWRIPVGATVLVQDIDGTLTLLVGEKDQLRVVHNPGPEYAQRFADLEAKRQRDRRAERKRHAQKRAQASEKPASAPSAEPVSTKIEVLDPAPTTESAAPPAPPVEQEKPSRWGLLGR